MCGIVGFIGPSAQSDRACDIVSRMMMTIEHRGPDDAGQWLDKRIGVALGHQRLAILDLSHEGHQPMACSCGRHVISYNGEIYNYRMLASRLSGQGTTFRSTCDTEVLVEAICAWGFENALDQIEGMFAIAHWDSQDHILHLARDRSGIKPIYFGSSGRTFLFASELKAIESHPNVSLRLNREALSLYSRLSYIPPPFSIYEGIQKLPPGTFLEVNADGERIEFGDPKPYWSARAALETGLGKPIRLSDDQAANTLEELLIRSVSLQRHADVPVGAFLSGGIDSSLVVALMQSMASAEPAETFSIGFKDERFDEAPFARAIAKHLGTRHTERYVTGEEALEVLPQLPKLYDEPFAESSQIPMVLLAQDARKQVKVVMTGDGGDELFGGYSWYDRLQKLWMLNRLLPDFLRARLANLVRAAVERPTVVSGISRVWTRLGDALETKPHQLLSVLEAGDPLELYCELRSEMPVQTSRHGAFGFGTILNKFPDAPRVDDIRLLAMYLDMMTFLPEHPLTKVDRATMAVGLEARVPLLDRDVMEFAWQLPIHQKMRRGTPKFLLREILYRHIPRALVDRPKVAFGAPLGEWLRGPMRKWADSLLAPDHLAAEGFFDSGRIGEAWRQHKEGKRDWTRLLWNVLVFNAWLESRSLL